MGPFHSPACAVVIILDSYVKLINPEGDSLYVTVEVTASVSGVWFHLISAEGVITLCLQNEPAQLDLLCDAESASLADVYTWLSMCAERHLRGSTVPLNERNLPQVMHFLLYKLAQKVKGSGEVWASAMFLQGFPQTFVTCCDCYQVMLKWKSVTFSRKRHLWKAAEHIISKIFLAPNTCCYRNFEELTFQNIWICCEACKVYQLSQIRSLELKSIFIYAWNDFCAL